MPERPDRAERPEKPDRAEELPDAAEMPDAAEVPDEVPPVSGGAAVAVRVAWAACALFWTVFAVLEAMNHGWPALVAAVLVFLLPDAAFLAVLRHAPRRAGGRLPPRAVPYYNALHHLWVPCALLVVYLLVPYHVPPVFAALCGWFAHLSWDRTFGFGLRDGEGFPRA